MTMTRSEKAKQLAAAKPEADGYTATQFQHPRLRREAQAERGHARMTPAEYVAKRMGRGGVSAEMARDTFARHSRYPRVVTRTA